LGSIDRRLSAATLHGVRIAGTGSYLPGPPISQDEVRARFRDPPDCLPERVQETLLAESGIQTRYFGVDLRDFAARESNTSMAAAAGRRALDAAGWAPSEVDLLVVTTVVPDQLMPPTSTLVQQALGIPACAEVEISANCTAPFKALQLAANQVRLGQCRRALVCSSQFVSFLGMPPWATPAQMTPSQAQLRWVLSDGAGAIALERAESDIDLRVWTESRATNRRPGLELPLGAAHTDLAAAMARGLHHVSQRARHLRTRAMREGLEVFARMLEQLELSAVEIDHAIPELPGLQYAEIARQHVVKCQGLRESTWRFDLPEIGNVGGATFPIVLDRLARNGRLSAGDLVASFTVESSNWIFAGVAFRWTS
jgi:3-oxoacyl-[acyl-carrier-protein] synthase-3